MTHLVTLAATPQLQFPIAIRIQDPTAIEVALHTINDMRAGRVGIFPRPCAVACVDEFVIGPVTKRLP